MTTGLEYVVGFDGSRGTVKGLADSTALVALPLKAPAVPRVLGYWEADGPGWEPPRDVIGSLVEAALGDRFCVGGGFDDAYWSDEVAEWQARFGGELRTRRLTVPTRSRARAWQLLKEQIELRVIVLDPKAADYDLIRTHLLGLREGDLVPGKEHSGATAQKVDVAAAIAYAAHARLEAIEAGIRPSHAPPPRWPSRLRTAVYFGEGFTESPVNVRCQLPDCGRLTASIFHSEECYVTYRALFPNDPQLTKRGGKLVAPAVDRRDRVEEFYGRQVGGYSPPTVTVPDGRGGYRLVDEHEASRRREPGL